MIDDYTATKGSNINRFSGHPVIPLKIKDHNIALPVLTDRIKKNNLQNYEKIFISNIINSKKYKSKCNDFFRFYHPWLSNIFKNEEINSFLAYCYDITKVTPPPVKISKIKINNMKFLKNQNNKENRNYRILNHLDKKKFINVSVGTNTNFKEGKLDKKTEKRLLSLENLDVDKNKYKFFNPKNDLIVSSGFRNSYFTSKKKGLMKNNTLLNSDYSCHDLFNNKNQRSSSLNKNINLNLNFNHSTLGSEYRTIKIRKIKNNDRYVDRKLFRDTYKIQSKFKA